MVAVANSLSMYATHKDSDIDLFIVTQSDTLWLTRLLVTLTLWSHGVWRHGSDIAGNFCLSFWITTDAMDLEKIAIENDIYLYNWIYHLKPIFTRGDVYEQFLKANNWVEIDEKQKKENMRSLLPKIITPAFCHPDEGCATRGSHTPECEYPMKSVRHMRGVRICPCCIQADSSCLRMTKKEPNKIYKIFDSLIRFFWFPKTLRKYKKL